MVIQSILLVTVCLNAIAAIPSMSIPIKATTAATGNDVDDCAIWVHPTDPAKSLVIVNDKGPGINPGGLYVYNLQGAQVQYSPVYSPQNPDIRYNVVFGSDTMDILVCVDREVGNPVYNKLRVFKIDPSKAVDTSGFLTEITTSTGIATGQNETYGHSLYRRHSDGALFSIVSPHGNTDFTQIQLTSDGGGKVKGSIVRTWGGSDISGDLCEGICCDDELGFIYICDEDTRVLKYYADPDKKVNTLVGSMGQNDGIVSDREGINIYRCADTTGYVLLSSQGNNQIKVYDRNTNEFKGTLIPEGMQDCDGLDVTAVPLGTQFPHGMAAFHLGSFAGSSFGFYDWSDIATALNLSTPCNTQRPDGTTGIASRALKVTLSAKSHQSFNFKYFQNTLVVQGDPRNSEIVKIAFYDLQGRLIRVVTKDFILNSVIALPSNTLQQRSGIYIVKCSLMDGTIASELVSIMYD